MNLNDYRVSESNTVYVLTQATHMMFNGDIFSSKHQVLGVFSSLDKAFESTPETTINWHEDADEDGIHTGVSWPDPDVKYVYKISELEVNNELE